MELVRPELAPVSVVIILEGVGACVPGRARHDGEAVAQMTDGRLAALPVSTDAVPCSFAGGAPAKVVALQLARAHAQPADSGEHQAPGADGEIDLQRPVGKARVDRVVHQLQQRLGGAAVVGEQRGGEAGVYPLPNGAHGHGRLILSRGHSAVPHVAVSPMSINDG